MTPIASERCVLVLGGTREARALADRLAAERVPVVTSLAGATSAPLLPQGRVRSGGFGGSEGLARWLAGRDVVALVDATHPFAARMGAAAVGAAQRAEVPLLRLGRPSWLDHPDAPSWTWVTGHDAAAREAAARIDRGCAFLTVGRQPLPDYLPWLSTRPVVVRVAEPARVDLPARWTMLTGRGPFRLTGELETLRRHEIRVLVAKDAGGQATSAKLTAAQSLGVHVVMVRRPPRPDGIPEVADVEAALSWVRARMPTPPAAR